MSELVKDKEKEFLDQTVNEANMTLTAYASMYTRGIEKNTDLEFQKVVFEKLFEKFPTDETGHKLNTVLEELENNQFEIERTKNVVAIQENILKALEEIKTELGK